MGRESARRLALITASIPVAAGIIRLSAAGQPAAIERPARPELPRDLGRRAAMTAFGESAPLRTCFFVPD
jgi:hypothetical protein